MIIIGNIVVIKRIDGLDGVSSLSSPVNESTSPRLHHRRYSIAEYMHMQVKKEQREFQSNNL